jgi:hypothetical protein
MVAFFTDAPSFSLTRQGVVTVSLRNKFSALQLLPQIYRYTISVVTARNIIRHAFTYPQDRT